MDHSQHGTVEGKKGGNRSRAEQSLVQKKILELSAPARTHQIGMTLSFKSVPSVWIEQAIYSIRG
jgi:hypothetical protein